MRHTRVVERDGDCGSRTTVDKESKEVIAGMNEVTTWIAGRFPRLVCVLSMLIDSLFCYSATAVHGNTTSTRSVKIFYAG